MCPAYRTQHVHTHVCACAACMLIDRLDFVLGVNRELRLTIFHATHVATNYEKFDIYVFSS